MTCDAESGREGSTPQALACRRYVTWPSSTASRPKTAQNALLELRQERLVVSQQGRAFFVRDPDRPLTGTSSARDDDVDRRLSALEAELQDLQARVAAVEHEQPGPNKEIVALRVQIMDLYSRMGQPYPHDPPAETELRREQAS